MDDIIDCYFSVDLVSAYRAKWNTGKSVRHMRAYQYHYCSSYCIQKARYQEHIEKCSGISEVVYNFTNQNLVYFADSIGNRRDLLLVANIDFETTAPTENFYTEVQNKTICCFIHSNTCFSSKVKPVSIVSLCKEVSVIH